jgi:molybdenum cofactor biosynthesis protein B
MSTSSEQHKAGAAKALPAVACAIITASDTRTPETDASGKLIRELLEAAGHPVAAYHIVKDEPDQISGLLDDLTAREDPPRVILVNGGTGITPRDRTYDAISSRLEKTLPGFGELFRMLSYEQVGAAAMLSRATAGVYRGCVVISMPGSSAAVELAMTRLILPEIQHLAWEVAGRQ